MNQKVLVAVTGMIPQIITETIYALYKQNNWVPDKIIVLTTLEGKAKIVQQLLGEQGYFTRLCQEYQLPKIIFNERTIKVISENQVELDDIRTAEQNNAAADLIVNEIYRLCQDENTELHISIAGGRKSMGFYIGYALSLFGRAQDKMSHVLVEENFEQNREFFYPPKQEHILITKNDMKKDAAKAQVMLAEIPFVRMTENKLQFAFERDLTFSQAVYQTQQILNGTRIKLDVEAHQVSIGDADAIKIVLAASDFCIYAAMAKRQKESKITTFIDEENSRDFAKDYMYFYQHFQHELRGETSKAYQKREDKLTDLLSTLPGSKRSEINRIFNEANSRIKKLFKKQMGEYGGRFEICGQGKNNAKTYTLNIDAHWIEIHIPK